MRFFRRLLASLLVFSLLLSSGFPAFAGEVIKPLPGPAETPLAVRPELLAIPPSLPSVLPQTGVQNLVVTEPNVAPSVEPTVAPRVEPTAMATLQTASPGASSDQTPKTGELSSTEAGRPFTGEAASAPSSVAEPPSIPSEAQGGVTATTLEKTSARPAPSRAQMLDAFIKNRADQAVLKQRTIVTWIKSWAMILGAPLAIKAVAGAFIDGRLSQHGAEAILAAGAVYGVWLMAKIARLYAKTRAAQSRSTAAVRALTRDNPARTPEEAQKRLKELETEAARHELAGLVAPQFAELFTALRDYGVHDAKLAKDMDYLQKFLAEVRTGERDHWTMTSMSYHLLTGSEDAIDELRADVWNDPAVGVTQVMGLEDHVAALRKSLETEHQPGYMPGRELKFLAARMDEAYGAMLRGVDARRKALVDRQLQRLEVMELRSDRPSTARALNALRKSFDEELAVIGSDPDGINEKFTQSLAASNRARINAIVSALAD